jgi:hypothetical protein
MHLRRCGESKVEGADDVERTVSDGRFSRRSAAARFSGWSHRGAGTGRVVAMAGRTQDRCREGSLVMAPATQRTIVVGSASTVTVTNREITKHRL